MTAVPDTRFNVLLIDDDPGELAIVERILSALTEAPVRIDHVEKCSEAVRTLNDHPYDLILLDNLLSPTISAEFSVPFIRSAFHKAEIAIISSDVTAPYLSDPGQIGVDHVVDKANMIAFLRAQVEARAPQLRRKAG